MTILDSADIGPIRSLKTINLATTPNTIELTISNPQNARTFGLGGIIGIIGRVRIDRTHPAAVRYLKAGQRSSQIHQRMGTLYTNFERAPNILLGVWAAFKLKLAEPRLIDQDMQTFDERRACEAEFRHLFT
jgi:hypothetical protein